MHKTLIFSHIRAIKEGFKHSKKEGERMFSIFAEDFKEINNDVPVDRRASTDRRMIRFDRRLNSRRVVKDGFK